MAGDKYSAVWVSHSSISDFLKCPRAYYLKHIYRDKKTGHKVKLVSPPLSFGQAVHEVIESLSVLPTEERLKESLIIKLNNAWQKVTGKRGGFPDLEVEALYKLRAEDMLKRVMANPGPLKNQAVKIKMDLPHFWLSDKDNIILCGKIDWLEYLPAGDSVHIIDFKTSKRDESPDSLQLPIYYLLVLNCQKRIVAKASYWYLDKEDGLIEQQLPDRDQAINKILEVAKLIKLSRQLESFKCKHGGCSVCQPYEAIIQNRADFVGVDEFKTDIYTLDSKEFLRETERESVIL